MNIDFKDSTIAIFGGSGSWGQELCTQLLQRNPKKIIIYSRGEISQVAMERKFHNKIIEYVIGDVRDSLALTNVFVYNKIDYVFQLAALKHVPICENQPWEAILTNISGIKNLIDVSIEYKVKKFVLVSTDKAVDPFNVYGLTKAVAEKLVIHANCLTTDTDFICIRSGNVLGTNGSLVPYVISQIAATNEILVTDKQMTRFFTTFYESVKFLIFAFESAVGGEIYVPRMPSFYISDVIDVLVECFGNGKTEVKIIGAREGEKMHELLISAHEITRTFMAKENCYAIRPQLKTGREYDVMEQCGLKQFSSKDNIHGKDHLKELLKAGGFI